MNFSDLKELRKMGLSQSGNITSIFTLNDYLKGKVSVDLNVFLPTIGENLQREFCWGLEFQQNFVKTVLLDLDIPKFCVIQKMYTIGKSQPNITEYQLIDGKQRFLSLLNYVENKFSVTLDGKEYYFKDFAENGMSYVILDYTFIGTIVFDRFEDEDFVTDLQKLYWFDRINTFASIDERKRINNLTKKFKDEIT